ncbi:DUF2267 domain-containing protein [Geminicoccus roseus]|uniref:DUF2267 domain-containing protein n=1 Tax=Geminicoccus roseus TaxID=404900 RepID=UPI0004863F45|nr:DUF2267 domain-containing protein [Geminicoccus roseus]
MSDAHSSWRDRGIGETEEWLAGIQNHCRLGSESHAFCALRAVLHALRDRMTVDQVADFASVLPMPVLAIYYEGWEPAGKPTTRQEIDAFLEDVEADLPPGFPCRSDLAAQTVCALLWREVDPMRMNRAAQALPVPLRCLAPSSMAR